MAAQKVNIASLQIDVNDVIKKSADLKKRLDDLKKAQKELDVTTEQGRQAFEQNAVEMKNLSKAYRDNQTFAASLEEANKDLTRTLEVENKSTQELYDSRRQLNVIAKNLKGDTDEEIALRKRLNDAIDEQTEALRDQQSEFNSSKDKVGEYQQGITAAFEEMNIFNGGLSGLAERATEAGGATNLATNSLKGMVTGLGAATKASLAFIATPVGIVLAAVAAAVLLVSSAMNRSEDSTNKIRKATSAFTGIISKLMKVLEPLGNFIIDNIVRGFELAEKAIFGAAENVARALEVLGFDKQAESLRNFTKEVEESAEQSKALAQAEIDLEKAQRNSRKLQLDFQKDAEKLRQIRDDEARSTKERMDANEQLGAVLKQQATEELAIAQQALAVANMRIAQDGERTELLNAQAEALTEIADIEERITGQQSEQLTNRVALQKEAADKAKEYSQQQIDRQKLELDLFIESQGRRAKSLEEQLAIEEEISKRSIEILKKELRDKLITQQEYDLELLTIQNDLMQRRAELAVDNAARELEQYNQLNQSKLDSEKFLTEQLYEEERSRLEALAEQRRQYEAKRLSEGVTTQQEYNAAINQVDEENRLALEELAIERKEAKAEQEAIDFENRLAIQAEQDAQQFEIAQAQLDRDRAAEVAAAEKTGASVALINKKYAAAQRQLDAAVTESKIEGFQAALGSFGQIAGEQTTLGKAIGIADATINSYKAYTLALATYPPPFGQIAAGAALAAGLVNVGKIAGVNTKFARGGILSGASHAQGGIKTPYGELEGGEAVLNKRSTRMFAPLLSHLNVLGGGKKFASGGILGSTSAPSSSMFDYETFAAKVAEANQSLPNPIVSVTDINNTQSKVNVIESISNF